MTNKQNDWKNSVKKDVEHIRKLSQALERNRVLSLILDNIETLDFLEIYYKEEPETLERIRVLKNKLLQGCDFREEKAIKKDLKELEPSDEEKFSILSEEILKIAEKLNLGIGFNNTLPYFYTGCYWTLLDKDILKEFLLCAAKKAGFKAYYIDVITRIEQLFKQFSYTSIIPTPQYDKNIVKINLSNGTFVVESDRQYLTVYNNNDLFKYQLLFAYDPLARAPRFMRFLDEVLPEKESQMILAEYIGYVFTKNLKMEKCLVLIGEGANGKSVVFEVMSALLGGNNTSSYTLTQLCNENGYFRVDLTNKLLNYASELGGKGCNPDTIKQLISNEPIMARSPYKDAFELRDYAKLMFNVNEFPKDIEQTKAFFRRFIFLDFAITIPEEKQDKSLADKIIKEELSGVFNWVLEGLKRLQKNKKFTSSSASVQKMQKIKEETDSVTDFMKDQMYKPTDDATKYKQVKFLFKEYEDFCKEYGYLRVAYKTFIARLRTIGYKIEGKKTNNQTWIYCEQIKESNENLDGILDFMGLK